MAKHERKIILINKPFQFKISGYVAVIFFVMSLIYPFTIYENFQLIAAQYQDNADILNLQKLMLLISVIMPLIMSAIIFFSMLFITHKIAGPIYKLKKSIIEYRQGFPIEKVVLRDGDHFTDLVTEFNFLVEKIEEQEQEQFKNNS